MTAKYAIVKIWIFNYSQKSALANSIDETPFDIPTYWKWIKFGELVNFKIGKTPSRHEKKYWDDGEFNWVSIADMVENGHITTTKEKVSERNP